MKIPKKFKLFGLTWTVIYRDPPDPARPGAWAYSDCKHQTICLSPDLAPDIMEQTFVHELLHILIFNQGLEHCFGYDSGKEEILVNSLTNGLYDLLKTRMLNV